jgi:hypothetical protein
MTLGTSQGSSLRRGAPGNTAFDLVVGLALPAWIERLEVLRKRQGSGILAMRPLGR